MSGIEGLMIFGMIAVSTEVLVQMSYMRRNKK